MVRLLVRALLPAALGLTGLCLVPPAGAEQDLSKARWVKSTAYVVPKETATDTVERDQPNSRSRGTISTPEVARMAAEIRRTTKVTPRTTQA